MRRDEKTSDPMPLGSLLSGAASRYGLDDASAVGSVWRKWVDLVGRDVAAHCEPTSLRSGVLRIRADSPVWAHEVGYLAEEIKSRVNALLGRDAVTEVRIWSGPSKTPRANAGGQTAARPRGADPTPPDEASQDPLSALERARGAWLARRAKRGR